QREDAYSQWEKRIEVQQMAAAFLVAVPKLGDAQIAFHIPPLPNLEPAEPTRRRLIRPDVKRLRGKDEQHQFDAQNQRNYTPIRGRDVELISRFRLGRLICLAHRPLYRRKPSSRL